MLRFTLLAFSGCFIVGRQVAAGFAFPRVPDHVAALEVPAVTGLLEQEVFREVLAVVPDVKTGHEHVLRPRRRDLPSRGLFTQPEYAQAAELSCRQRVRRARIAPGHVPRILQEYAAVVLGFHLARKHVPVEIGETAFHERGNFHIAGQPDGAVVGGLHAAGARQGVNIEILLLLRVERTEADGQHEPVAFVGDLQRTQVGIARRLLLLDIHLRDKKAHVLLQVAADDLVGAARDTIAVVVQPPDQAIALLGGKNQDVVLADRVTCLDGNALRPGLRFHDGFGRWQRGHILRHFQPAPDRARIRVEVLDEPR